MRIAVIGTFVLDEIIHPQGRVSRSWGGLMHTLHALLALSDAQDQILPIAYVGQDVAKELLSHLSHFPQIDISGLKILNQPNNRVRLTYVNARERVERSLDPLPPLGYSELQPALESQGVIVNMISGWDVTLAALRQLKDKSALPLALDVHSLLLGRASDGKRYFRVLPAIKDWLCIADIIQMNHQEYHRIGKFLGKAQDFWRLTCFKKAKIINLTFRHHGSRTYVTGRQEITCLKQAAPRQPRVIDPTGCGDSFLAGFVYTYWKVRDVKRAAQVANQIAACAGSVNGVAQVWELKSKMKEFYG